jgi:putative restriction endonuclease
MFRSEFQRFIYETNADGSGKADSYIRALDMLGPILTKHYPHAIINGSMWHSFTQDELTAIHKWLRAEAKAAENGKIDVLNDFNIKQRSYLMKGFCSAAVKAYREFLAVESEESEIIEAGVIESRGKNVAKMLKDKITKSEEILSSAFDKDNKGRERLRSVMTRMNQSVFRKMVLLNYNTKCCLTGLSIPEVLRASHISAWSEDEKNRLNPENGLCLSATYDAAFDRHLISFDEDYRLILSNRLKDFYTDEVSKQWFHKREGQKIEMPVRFLPSQVFLEMHRDCLVK